MDSNKKYNLDVYKHAGQTAINGITVTNATIFQETTETYDFNFYGCTFISKLVFRGSIGAKLVFKNCVFKADMETVDGKVDSIEFNDCKFTEQTWRTFHAGEVFFRVCQGGMLTIRNLQIDNLSYFQSPLSLKISCNQALQTQNPKTLYFFLVNKSTVSIRGVNILSLTVTGESHDGFEVKNCRLQTCVFGGFSTSGGFVAHRIAPTKESNLTINDSDLSGARVNFVDFSQFSVVRVIGSQIDGIVIRNVTLCRTVDGNPSDRRHTYRQLKNIAIAIKDRPEELKFKGLEMDAYHRELKGAKGRGEERFILCTNRWSNLHGLSAGRAIGWLALSTAIFFTAIKFCMGHTHWDPSLFWSDATNVVEFLNPAHKFRDVFCNGDTDCSDSGLARFLDALFRIVSGYLLFQFVRAFRRFAS